MCVGVLVGGCCCSRLRVRLSTRQQSGGHWGCCCSPGLRVRLSTCQQNGCGCPQSLLPLPDHRIHRVTSCVLVGAGPMFPGSAEVYTSVPSGDTSTNVPVSRVRGYHHTTHTTSTAIKAIQDQIHPRVGGENTDTSPQAHVAQEESPPRRRGSVSIRRSHLC